MSITTQQDQLMTNREPKVPHNFMELSTDEMNESIGIAETYLNKFKVGGRCHWGLRPNVDKVMRLIAAIALSKKLRLRIIERSVTRREYDEFRNHALSILENAKVMSPPEWLQHKREVFSLAICSTSILELINELFEIGTNNRWVCKIPKSELLKGFFENPIKVEPDVLELIDFKDLLRFIILVQNNLMFIFSKDIKEVGRHVLSDAKHLITTTEGIINNIPKFYSPKIMVSDGTNFDIQVLRKDTGETTWTSLLGFSDIVNRDFVRAFKLIKHKGNSSFTFRELFEYSEIYKTLPKKSEYKQLQLKEEAAKIKQTLTHDQLEEQLREAFAKLKD